MSDERLFDPDQTEIADEEVSEETEQQAEEVDPRLVTDKEKTGHTIRCRNLAEKLELRDVIDRFKASRGAAKVGDVVPAITSLIEGEIDEPPAAISAHMNAAAEGLDLVRKQLSAISACYATVEKREAAKAQDTITNQANEITALRNNVDELKGEWQGALDGLLETQSQLNARESECATLRAEVEKQRGMLATLIAALALTPEQQAAAVAALCGEKDGE